MVSILILSFVSAAIVILLFIPISSYFYPQAHCHSFIIYLVQYIVSMIAEDGAILQGRCNISLSL